MEKYIGQTGQRYMYKTGRERYIRGMYISIGQTGQRYMYNKTGRDIILEV